MKRLLIFTFSLMGISVASGQTPGYDQDTVDINQYVGTIDSEGNLFSEFLGGISIIPRDYASVIDTSIFAGPSGFSSFYGAAFNYTGISQQGDSLLSARNYDTDTDFSPGPYTSSGIGNISLWNKTYKTTSQEIDFHVQNAGSPGYQIPNSIQEWPAHGQPQFGQSYLVAPFTDSNGNGAYEPSLGEAPCVEGDMAVLAIYNDGLPSSFIGQGPGSDEGAKVGLEIHNLLFAYEEGSYGGLMDSVIFLRQTIQNKRSDSILDLRAMLWFHAELGFVNGADRFEYDVPRKLAIFYDCNGYTNGGCSDDTLALQGRAPQVSAIQLMEGPPAPVNNQVDDDQDGIVDEVGERYGVESVILYYGVGVGGEPNTLSHWHHFSKARWRDGRRMIHAGNGIDGSSFDPTTKYYFPRVSHPDFTDEWSEESAGFVPIRKRGFMNVGPLDLAPGEKKTLYFAFHFSWPEAGDQFTGIPKLKTRADALSQWWENNHSTPSCYASLSLNSQHRTSRVYPNPTKGRLNIELDGPDVAYSWTIHDFQGRVLRQGISEHAKFSLNVEDFSPGLYVLSIYNEDFQGAHKVLIE
ncbi:T9SS type A sorting domain-containing protein [Cryomorphaceae bacterium]|nr:T9SS type A sorting domain-containing protein [Cryomorphaceae bacterium]